MHGDEKLLLVRSKGKINRALFYHFGALDEDPSRIREDALGSPNADWGQLRAETN